MSQNIIEIKNVSKTYGDNTVLNNLSLNIRKNEFLTLLGPSGCGKTTTLKILAGFENSDIGKVLLDEPLGALDLKLRKEMQSELKRIQQRLGITFIFVTHDQEEALTMSDTIVVMNKGIIQQMGSPEDIYNEPANAFVADFIGESNIVDGIMLEDLKVEFCNHVFTCVDKGFNSNEVVDVVIRPEDIEIISPEKGMITGKVNSVKFKGVHYEIEVIENEHKWIVHNIKNAEIGAMVGLNISPESIHIMRKVMM